MAFSCSGLEILPHRATHIMFFYRTADGVGERGHSQG